MLVLGVWTTQNTYRVKDGSLFILATSPTHHNQLPIILLHIFAAFNPPKQGLMSVNHSLVLIAILIIVYNITSNHKAKTNK